MSGALRRQVALVGMGLMMGGCVDRGGLQEDAEVVTVEALAEPAEGVAEDTWVHPTAGMVFPRVLGKYRRLEVKEFREADWSVGCSSIVGRRAR